MRSFVFALALNDNMEVVAVVGSFASVIGGAPAAAVVFVREVSSRTSKDPRVVELEAELTEADEGRQAQIRLELAELRTAVRSEKLGECTTSSEHGTWDQLTPSSPRVTSAPTWLVPSSEE